jgi:hypothetical protein
VTGIGHNYSVMSARILKSINGGHRGLVGDLA